LFGEVTDGNTRLNDTGRLIDVCGSNWTTNFRWSKRTNSWLPNHFHGIIVLTDRVGADLPVGLYRIGRAGMPGKAHT